MAVATRGMVWTAAWLVVLTGTAGLAAARAAPPPTVEAAAAPAPEVVETPPPAAASVHPGDLLEPGTVHCAAARHSSLATLLDARRGASCSPQRGVRARAAKQAHARRVVLALAAEEARNADAGLALELYWSLAEAEHSLAVIRPAVTAVDRGMADLATLADRGVELPLDAATLEQRRLALDDAAVAAAAARDGLSVAVARLTRMPPGPRATIHPSAGFPEVDDPDDVERLVAIGLERRPQLRMLRAMLTHLDEDTVDTGTMVLSLVHPGLGVDAAGSAASRVVPARRRAADTATVARQLRQLLLEREAAVAAEIRRAERLAAGAADRVVIAERQVEIAGRAAGDARARQAVAEADAFKVLAADLELAAANRTLIERLAAWQRARVDIREAQGLLAAECGLSAAR